MTMVEKEETHQTDFGCRPKISRRSSLSLAPDQHFVEMTYQKSTAADPIAPSQPTVRKTRHVRSVSDTTGLNLNHCNKIQLASPHCSSDYSTNNAVNQGSILAKETKPRFLDDGGSSIIVPAGGLEYPKRQRGQSLLEYLVANHASKTTYAELDRENAHFSVSEAMIAAIEETRFYKWKCTMEEEEDEKLIAEDDDEDSDEEVRCLKMKLRMQHTTPQSSQPIFQVSCIDTSISSPTLSFSPSSSSLASSGVATSGPRDSGVSFSSLCFEVERERRKSRKLARLKRCERFRSAGREHAHFASSTSGDDTPVSTTPVDAYQLTSSGSRRALFSPSSSSSSLSAISTPRIHLSPVDESSGAHLTAENVALTLLGHFSQLRLPHETDMEWLVSEKDAPQHLLPMPQSWPVNPDEPFMQLRESDSDESTTVSTKGSSLLRGNNEWAPPRPQIVFAVYSSPNLKVVMAKQNYRCAGCGLKVEPEHSRNFRYCHYLGRYFCTACHANKTSVIPSRIFKKWDFRKYPVSNFSHDLLERMWYDPLFRLGYINPLLYRRCRQLNKVLELRLQLIHVAEFLRHCRYAAELWEDFRKQTSDWLDDAEIYSLHDLMRVNTGELYQILRVVVTRGMNHVIECELCKARGFFCEKCRSSEVIFPFQLDAVVRCEKCGSCFHRPCWSAEPQGREGCPRCQRLSRRSSTT